MSVQTTVVLIDDLLDLCERYHSFLETWFLMTGIVSHLLLHCELGITGINVGCPATAISMMVQGKRLEPV